MNKFFVLLSALLVFSGCQEEKTKTAVILVDMQ